MSVTPLLVAHRGASQEAAENTIGAITAAAALGADLVEIDVRWTQRTNRLPTGVPVLLHDADVDRTTDGSGSLGDFKLKKFLELRTPGGEPPATLDGAVAAVAATSMELMLELKGIAGPARLAVVEEILRTHDMVSRTVLATFDAATVERLRKRMPEARLGLVDGDGTVDVPPGVEHHVKHTALVSPVTRATTAWTANDPAEWERLAGLGVQRIITDDVRGYAAWRAGRSAASG
jgi:glycerophosphoryl diester phosphodiesterase